ncbi:type 1 glutamine amidotransferase domain-containing protein [Peribacillus frigoritolerans]|uniref:type 1 glutamine amidotransferase domain-containing protein n=1 Tax=Peribacillus frigoritolerans TaxID=450367 RepID=UPI00105A64AB|nr:type 1 glutamine amidotransferase domain-containing protein [Peribacillus frigoritolerans]TDL79142.1 type 1 glutamine amidotransferase domain-containing protein [Peribacillus frigoritolerans]
MAEKILVVVTTADKITEEYKTGLWLSEFAEPYAEFTANGYEVTVASPKGGDVPLDPSSLEGGEQDKWPEAISRLKDTEVLDDIQGDEYAGIFLPGGHGTMFDFPSNNKLQELLVHFAESDKVIGAVCHGPAGFVGPVLSNGKPLVEGRRLTGFTNEEEVDTKLAQYMPFLLETELTELGAEFVTTPKFTEHVEVDGKLVTGQNPQSSENAAKEFVKVLSK